MIKASLNSLFSSLLRGVQNKTREKDSEFGNSQKSIGHNVVIVRQKNDAVMKKMSCLALRNEMMKFHLDGLKSIIDPPGSHNGVIGIRGKHPVAYLKTVYGISSILHPNVYPSSNVLTRGNFVGWTNISEYPHSGDSHHSSSITPKEIPQSPPTSQSYLTHHPILPSTPPIIHVMRRKTLRDTVVTFIAPAISIAFAVKYNFIMDYSIYYSLYAKSIDVFNSHLSMLLNDTVECSVSAPPTIPEPLCSDIIEESCDKNQYGIIILVGCLVLTTVVVATAGSALRN